MAAVWSHLSIHPAVLSSLFTTHRVGFMETSKWQGQFDKNKENQPILFCLDINNALSIYLIQQLCVWNECPANNRGNIFFVRFQKGEKKKNYFPICQCENLLELLSQSIDRILNLWNLWRHLSENGSKIIISLLLPRLSVNPWYTWNFSCVHGTFDQYSLKERGQQKFAWVWN